MIKVLAFDFGGVSFTWNLEKLLDEFSKELGLSKEIVSKAWNAKITEFEKGKISEDEYWDAFLHVIQQDCDRELLHRIVIDHFKPIPEVLELMQKLRGKYKIGLISAHTTWIDDLEQQYHFRQNFDFAIVSKEVNCTKPEPEIFQILIQRAQCKPEEIVFIDDDPENKAAENLGIQFILYTNFDKLISDLQKLGVTV